MLAVLEVMAARAGMVGANEKTLTMPAVITMDTYRLHCDAPPRPYISIFQSWLSVSYWL